MIWFADAGIAMIGAGQACLGSPKVFPALLLIFYLAIMAYVMPLPQIFFGLALFIWLALAGLKKSVRLKRKEWKTICGGHRG